jgi:putative endonuclease
MRRVFYVYILASDSRELFVGVTNNPIRRIAEHRSGADPYHHVFRHATARLVHIEAAGEARDAVRRERQLKGWSRRRKIALIDTNNPKWEDLAAGWPAAEPA